MITTQILINIRTLAFGVGGMICAGYALAAFLSGAPETLPHWLPPLAGGVVALIYFLAAWVAGPANINAAVDEAHRQDGRLAATTGFWAALAIGTTLWLTGTGGTLQLAITLTSAAATYLLTHVVLDLRGRA